MEEKPQPHRETKKKFKTKGNFKVKPWRKQFKKNFGNVQEGKRHGFLNKNAIKREYFREMKIDRRKSQDEKDEDKDTADPYAKYNIDKDIFEKGERKQKISKYKKAKNEYKNKVQEKQRRQEEAERRRKEIEEKKQKAKETRLHRYKKLNQKTRKGQPLMKGRMELLLQDVENLLAKEKQQEETDKSTT